MGIGIEHDEREREHKGNIRVREGGRVLLEVLIRESLWKALQ